MGVKVPRQRSLSLVQRRIRHITVLRQNQKISVFVQHVHFRNVGPGYRPSRTVINGYERSFSCVAVRVLWDVKKSRASKNS